MSNGMEHLGHAVTRATHQLVARAAAEVVCQAGKLIGRHRGGDWGADADLEFTASVARMRVALEGLNAGCEKRRADKRERFLRWDAQQREPAIGPYALGACEYPGVAKLVEECGALLAELNKVELSAEAIDLEGADVLAACDFFIRRHDERRAGHVLSIFVASDVHIAAAADVADIHPQHGDQPTYATARCQRCDRSWRKDEPRDIEDVSRFVEAIRLEHCRGKGSGDAASG